MAPKFVVPYRLSGKHGKNDAADTAAICEALQRPSMRFVPIKDEAQQARLTIHRVRQGFGGLGSGPYQLGLVALDAFVHQPVRAAVSDLPPFMRARRLYQPVRQEFQAIKLFAETAES